jgi:hypothetical protein
VTGNVKIKILGLDLHKDKTTDILHSSTGHPSLKTRQKT